MKKIIIEETKEVLEVITEKQYKALIRLTKKDTNINIKLTSDEKAIFKNIAKERGLSLTNLILQELRKLYQ